MQVRPVHLAVAALTALAALASAGTAQASTSAANDPVGRYTAFQTCEAAMWKWTAENAKIGTSVSSFRQHYRDQDVWRERHGWHVQLGGKRGQQVSATNLVSYCVVAGTNAQPKVIEYAYPR